MLLTVDQPVDFVNSLLAGFDSGRNPQLCYAVRQRLEVFFSKSVTQVIQFIHPILTLFSETLGNHGSLLTQRGCPVVSSALTPLSAAIVTNLQVSA